MDTYGHDDLDHFVFDQIEHLRKQFKRFALVFLLRILLRIATQVDTLTQMIQRSQMLTPVAVDALQHDATFKTAEGFFTDHIDLGVVASLSS